MVGGVKVVDIPKEEADSPRPPKNDSRPLPEALAFPLRRLYVAACARTGAVGLSWSRSLNHFKGSGFDAPLFTVEVS